MREWSQRSRSSEVEIDGVGHRGRGGPKKTEEGPDGLSWWFHSLDLCPSSLATFSDSDD